MSGKWPHHIEVFKPSWIQKPEDRGVMADMVMWCLLQAGKPAGKENPYGRWMTKTGDPIREDGGRKRRVFMFKEDDVAVAFKLRWAEYL